MRIPLPENFQILYQRNFRLYWTGQLVSLTGMWMQAVAASWLVLQLTNSALQLSAVNFAFAAPGLLLMLYGGVAADRFDRRSILVITQAVLMAVALFTGLLVGTHQITFWMLLGLSVFGGTAMSFDHPRSRRWCRTWLDQRTGTERLR